MKRSAIIALMVVVSFATVGTAANVMAATPEATHRTHVQNFRDMVLATCLASAYQGDRQVAIDTGSSASALRDWTSFDLERSPDAVRTLIDRYLARDYRNPLAEAEVGKVRFDLLKCLDLYHSKDMDEMVKRLVIAPDGRD